jgi:energy-converting hydrogenase B subunit D
MLVMQVAILLFVAAAGTGVVLTRHPVSQTIAVSFYGLLLAVMFFIYQAPDVALSQIVVGTVALPLMVMLALARMRRAVEAARQSTQRGARQHEHEEEAG